MNPNRLPLRQITEKLHRRSRRRYVRQVMNAVMARGIQN